MQTKRVIDATGRSLGRVAAEAAKALMGKTSPDYTPNELSDVKIMITNASKLAMRDKKLAQKRYWTYSGYPSGLHSASLRALVGRKGYKAALKLAITRMLPRNSMRVGRLRNVTIES